MKLQTAVVARTFIDSIQQRVILTRQHLLWVFRFCGASGIEHGTNCVGNFLKGLVTNL